MQESYTTKFFKTSFGDIPAYTFSMRISDLLHIHYVAVRGVDDEEGAVQRILNKRRIKSIKEYVLDGDMFLIRLSLIGQTITSHQKGVAKT